ncbi:MAG: hypothetical protein PHU23_14295, partial [Dehalococcoidales bacterium]|nr:hypothetical protein [Dehalococcoidales bacterium]
HKGLTNRTQFIFRVRYTDPNNLPPSGDLALVITRSGSTAITNIQLLEEDSTDTTYNNGKYYTATTKIFAAGDYTGALTVSNSLGYTASSPGIDGTLSVTSDALGDLSAYAFDNWGPGFTAGVPFDNTLYFYNDGTASTNAEVTFYVSPSRSLTDAYQLKILKYPEDTSISAGGYGELWYSIWIPATIPQGSYYLGINFKSSNDIKEEEEQFWDTELIQVNVGLDYNHPGLAYCYPSPAYLSKGDKIHFAALPPDAEISIMLPTGHIIKKFTADENGSVSPWDGATDNDGVIGSGIYLVSVSVLHSDTRRVFKILVFR